MSITTTEEANHVKFLIANVPSLVSSAHRLIPRNRKPGDLPTGKPFDHPDYEAIENFILSFQPSYLDELSHYLQHECANLSIPPGSNALQLQRLLIVLRRILSNNWRPERVREVEPITETSTQDEEEEEYDEKYSKDEDDHQYNISDDNIEPH